MPAIIGGATIGAAILASNSARSSNRANANLNKVNREFNAREAHKQRMFQQHQRRTQHFEQVGDLRRAGLNPILSANLGGAGVPSAATATAPGSIPMQPEIGPGAIGAVGAATSAFESVKKRDQISNQVKLLVQQTDLTNAQAWGQDIQNAFGQLQIDEKIVAIRMLEEELKIKRRLGEMTDTEFGTVMGYLREFTSSVLGGGSLVPTR